MPPHGGFGTGLERLTMQLLELQNVRNASLFPINIKGCDLFPISRPKIEE
ncbi:amino acid--tRNA ligase-related protein [Thermoactinomyces daqus]